MVTTAGIILLVLAFNTLATISVTKGKYRDALVERTTAVANGIKKDINKAIGFGLPLNALEGMGDKLRVLTEEDKDISRALVMDNDGHVLYASDKSIENTVMSDPASKEALAATGPTVQSYSDEAGGHIEKVMPITGLDGKRLGVFRMALNESARSTSRSKAFCSRRSLSR